jgi:hypothetical protein
VWVKILTHIYICDFVGVGVALLVWVSVGVCVASLSPVGGRTTNSLEGGVHVVALLEGNPLEFSTHYGSI